MKKNKYAPYITYHRGNMMIAYCQWWLQHCPEDATTLILACCEQGHIHERLLCTLDTAAFIFFIGNKQCQCNTCGQPLIKHLTRTPVENHWDLTAALAIHHPIMITSGEPVNMQTAPADVFPYPDSLTENVAKAEEILKTYRDINMSSLTRTTRSQYGSRKTDPNIKGQKSLPEINQTHKTRKYTIPGHKLNQFACV